MTIHERMQPRSEREKDLLKYGRRQGREQAQTHIIQLLNEHYAIGQVDESVICACGHLDSYALHIESLIEREK